MTDDITATFTVEELVLFKGGLEKLRFQGGEQDRERVWVLIKKVDALLPPEGFEVWNAARKDNEFLKKHGG